MESRKFRRHDGVIGVGFLIPWAGTKKYSIAWPDSEALRYVPEDIESGALGIEIVEEEAESDESVLGPSTMEAIEEMEHLVASPSEAAAIRDYLTEHGVATPNKQVIAAFAASEIIVTSAQVTAAKKALAAS